MSYSYTCCRADSWGKLMSLKSASSSSLLDIGFDEKLLTGTMVFRSLTSANLPATKDIHCSRVPSSNWDISLENDSGAFVSTLVC